MPKYSKRETAEAIERLREVYPKGSTVYTILRHVSASGMSRDISLVAFRQGQEGEGFTLHPNYSAAVALGEQWVSRDGHDSLRVKGCGVDHGALIAAELSHLLYGDRTSLKRQVL